MNTKEAAALLNGREYREEITRDEEAAFKDHGLVALFGASDDLAEFRGAWHDEEGAYGGGSIRVNEGGIVRSACDSGDQCPYFTDKLAMARTIDAVFDEDGMTWLYRTDIPHETFTIMEDGDTYCRGIVFAAGDAA